MGGANFEQGLQAIETSSWSQTFWESSSYSCKCLFFSFVSTKTIGREDERLKSYLFVSRTGYVDVTIIRLSLYINLLEEEKLRILSRVVCICNSSSTIQQSHHLIWIIRWNLFADERLSIWKGLFNKRSCCVLLKNLFQLYRHCPATIQIL